jgi:topoisomerase-4 subunit A
VDTCWSSAAKGSGRVYSVTASALPGGRGDGVPITTMIDLEAGTQIAHYFAGAPDTVLLLANTGGFGLLAKAATCWAATGAARPS